MWYNFLRGIFGTATADRLTNYQYWRIPTAENVDPPRVTTKVKAGDLIELPEFQLYQMVDAHRGKPQSKDGVMTGRPMQWGSNGFRRISWGYLKWGIKNYAIFPNPLSGFYWKTGHPVPMYDRHCIVRENNLDKKIFHETIQLDESVNIDSPFSNNALAWGRFEDGVLVEGDYSTATKNAAHFYVWTPWSKFSSHRLSLTVTDYDGADGSLSGIGIKAGSLVMLPSKSQSYINMITEGGECAAIAKAFNEFGAVVIDIGGTNGLAVQPGLQWSGSNISRFNIKLQYLVYAIEEEES
jgi:hypothetical protein